MSTSNALPRVLMQYATLPRVTKRLQIGWFKISCFLLSGAERGWCAHARCCKPYGTHLRWTVSSLVDYETVRFGRFDPALLAQARKRIAAATETWSALAGGDRNKIKPAADQFSLVCDSLRKLNPGSESLAVALTKP